MKEGGRGSYSNDIALELILLGDQVLGLAVLLDQIQMHVPEDVGPQGAIVRNPKVDSLEHGVCEEGSFGVGEQAPAEVGAAQVCSDFKGLVGHDLSAESHGHVVVKSDFHAPTLVTVKALHTPAQSPQSS